MSRLTIDGVEAGYNSNLVLRRLSLTIDGGETVAITGTSGSGKTTLLLSIAGFHPLRAGVISLSTDGEPLYAPHWPAGAVLLVPQNVRLLPHRTLRGNIELPLRRVGRMSRDEARHAATRVAEAFGIQDLLHRYPEEVSGGQLQRAGIARVAALRGRVLLLDEVTSAVDEATKQNVVDAIFAARRYIQHAITIVVTHDTALARRIADRVLTLKDGMLSSDAASETLP